MNKQLDLFNGYPFPKSNIQEVLLTLIIQRNVSLFDFPTLSGFRTRVSNLQLTHGLKLETQMIKRCNKFGNPYRYALHRLPESEFEKAVKLYYKLLNENPSN